VLAVDDYVYVLDFGEELEYVVEMEELLQDAHGSSTTFASISILEGAYFQHSYSKTENKGDEEDGGGLK
jgi:hypothetical protein